MIVESILVLNADGVGIMHMLSKIVGSWRVPRVGQTCPGIGYTSFLSPYVGLSEKENDVITKSDMLIPKFGVTFTILRSQMLSCCDRANRLPSFRATTQFIFLFFSLLYVYLAYLA